MSTEVSVCIATHRRPHLLQRLLTSILEQVDAPIYEVIVVDNDAARSAEPVAEVSPPTSYKVPRRANPRFVARAQSLGIRI
jgi:GT2 family glycosyltransferase